MKVVLWSIIMLLGLFVVLLFHKGKRSYSNKILIVYLISQILGTGNNLLFYYKNELLPTYIHFYMIGYPVVFLWLPLFYFFIKSLLFKNFRIKKMDIVHIIPFLLAFSFFLVNFILKDTQTKILLLNNYENAITTEYIFKGLLAAQIVFYNFLAQLEFRKYRRKLKENEHHSPGTIGKVWLHFSIYGFMVASLIVAYGLVSAVASKQMNTNWYLVSFTIFLLFFIILFYLSVINPEIIVQVEKSHKYVYSRLQKNDLTRIIEIVDHYIYQKSNYLNELVNLKDVARETGLNERSISQAINELRQVNFSDYINGFRIERARQLLTDPGFSDKKILFIAFESGFNSKTTFNDVFKKHTGLTPSAYRKRHLNS
jgi:AraC-like DNA-binding protein